MNYGEIIEQTINFPMEEFRVIDNKDANGTLTTELSCDEEGPDTMLDIPGYH